VDNFHKVHSQVAIRIFIALFVTGAIVIGTGWVGLYLIEFTMLQTLILCSAIALSASILISGLAAQIVLEPLKALSEAILHVDPDHHEGHAAPNLDKIKLGRELVSTLALEVYQFASHENSSELIEHRKSVIQAANIVSRMPLPIFVFNKELQVTNASNAALEYCEIESSSLFGKPIFDSLNLEFGNENTLEKWIQDCQANKVTDTGYWERVRVRLKDGKSFRQCDISAYYNRDNTSGTDFIVTLFDRTERYNQDDASMSFVALAVHELRTPLTVLRGYIEVFEDELGDKLSPEHHDFMLKMEASANQLTSFVHNILHVARIDNNQLSLQLTEEKWPDVLKEGAAAMELFAQVHGKTITFEIDPKLPTAAVDKVTICEVVNNLLDNAVKYSPNAKDVKVRSYMNQAGMIETTVQDFGVGIPGSVLPNLFEKFYRNHRTRTQIGGTGLGLYLCKSIVSAHGGNIWADSKEGEGSTFGFTIQPYSKVAAELKTGNKDITRQANGWIKNHSYYRR
jgi:signal transduction histidine kinase